MPYLQKQLRSQLATSQRLPSAPVLPRRRPHIADYDISQDGATRAIRQAQTRATRMGTDGFIAPEIEAGGVVSAAADLYSLGRTVEAVVPDEPTRRPEPLKDLIAQNKLASALMQAQMMETSMPQKPIQKSWTSLGPWTAPCL